MTLPQPKVEMGFLMRWLDTQTPDVVATVKELVAADRLQLISAGWAMHDEACVTWLDAIDQMSLGHRLANDVQRLRFEPVEMRARLHCSGCQAHPPT
jgi:hypothetical protein